MTRRQVILGIALGVAIAAGVLALAPGGPQGDPPGVVLAECGGGLRELVVQYEGGAREAAGPVFRDFLRQLAPEVTVHAVCPDRAAFDELAALVEPLRCQLAPVIAEHPMTAWSRDRWVAVACEDGLVRLVCPASETAATVWPQREGDQRIAEDLAAAVAGVRFRRSELCFDGGDVLATPRHAILTARVLPRNVGRVADAADLILRMHRTLGRDVLLLDRSPDHHAAMFMMAANADTMLVASPAMAREILTAQADPNASSAVADLLGGADFSADTQALFDAVADQCRRAGYRVVRIPVVPARDGRTYLTYVNVLIDRTAGRDVVCMPVYRGAEPLNAAATEVWEDLGFEVRPVDCTSVYRHFGCLHCLVNVLRRG